MERNLVSCSSHCNKCQPLVNLAPPADLYRQKKFEDKQALLNRILNQLSLEPILTG